jgi:hypothetical protein
LSHCLGKRSYEFSCMLRFNSWYSWVHIWQVRLELLTTVTKIFFKMLGAALAAGLADAHQVGHLLGPRLHWVELEVFLLTKCFEYDLCHDVINLFLNQTDNGVWGSSNCFLVGLIREMASLWQQLC